MPGTAAGRASCSDPSIGGDRTSTRYAILNGVHGSAQNAGHEGNVLVDRSGPTRRFHIVDGETTFAGKQPYAPKSVLLPFLDQGPRQLSPKLWARLRRTDVNMWRVDLLTLGIPKDRIDAAVQRLELVKTHGLDAIRRGFAD
jgi:hypothetical protein